MVRKFTWVAAFAAFSLMASPAANAAGLEMEPSAGCTATLMDCYAAAAKINDFWYRWAAGIDCELDYVECARQLLIGS